MQTSYSTFFSPEPRPEHSERNKLISQKFLSSLPNIVPPKKPNNPITYSPETEYYPNVSSSPKEETLPTSKTSHVSPFPFSIFLPRFFFFFKIRSRTLALCTGIISEMANSLASGYVVSRFVETRMDLPILDKIVTFIFGCLHRW